MRHSCPGGIKALPGERSRAAQAALKRRSTAPQSVKVQRCVGRRRGRLGGRTFRPVDADTSSSTHLQVPMEPAFPCHLILLVEAVDVSAAASAYVDYLSSSGPVGTAPVGRRSAAADYAATGDLRTAAAVDPCRTWHIHATIMA